MGCKRSLLLCFFIFGKTMGISLTDFYPYGSGHRDTYLAKNDDGSSPPIHIHISFPYFNQSHRTIFVSIDWLIDLLYVNATTLHTAFFTSYIVVARYNVLLLRRQSTQTEHLVRKLLKVSVSPPNMAFSTGNWYADRNWKDIGVCWQGW